MNTHKNMIKELEELCAKQKEEIERLKCDILTLNSVISQKEDMINRMIEVSKFVNEKKANISESKPNYESICKKLQDQHQSDCVTINHLHTTIDTLCDKYIRLREIHGL